MDASQVQELFRRAVTSDDAAAMREGLERMLGPASTAACPRNGSTSCDAPTS